MAIGSEVVTTWYKFDIDTNPSASDPNRARVLRLAGNIAFILALFPKAELIKLVDHMPESRIDYRDGRNNIQRLPLPIGRQYGLLSQFERVDDNTVLANIVLPGLRGWSERTYSLNQASIEGTEISGTLIPSFSFTSFEASSRFFARKGDGATVTQRTLAVSRYLNELNASLEFVLSPSSGCEYTAK